MTEPSNRRTIHINITGDTGELQAMMRRYAAWPAWRRWLWRRGIGR